MEIVIKIHDIPQNDHERWVLKNGTPLPKGHGDLKDVSKFIYNCDYNNGLGCDVVCHCDNCIHCIITEKAVNTAQTIIPADKEVEDEGSD